MRHLKAGNRKFGRSVAHRRAMFRNMVTALVRRERVRTTLAKAKELRGKVEKVITLGKKGTLHARRIALKHVAERETLLKVFGPLSERYADRPGGYSRIIKIGNRPGDDAPMAYIELVDREEELEQAEEKKSKKAAGKKTEKKAEKKTEGKSKKPEEKKAPEKKAKDKKEKPAAKTENKKDDAEKK